MNNSLVLSTFVKQLDECLEDIVRVYPEICKTDPRFLKGKMYFETLKRTNPRLIIVTWKSKINEKYQDKILTKDINFFIEKDYQEDASEYYNQIESVIQDLRNIIRSMSPTNIDICLKYIQNLCKLAGMYTV